MTKNKRSYKHVVISCFAFILMLLFIILFLRSHHIFIPLNRFSEPANLTLLHAERNDTINIDIIEKLTDEQRVIDYFTLYHQLPDYYLTKKVARRYGWNEQKGNLCEVLPGRAIGGDHFYDTEHRLPYLHDRLWFEADINYHCGQRRSDRLIFSNDGLLFVTYDHYQTLHPVTIVH